MAGSFPVYSFGSGIKSPNVAKRILIDISKLKASLKLQQGRPYPMPVVYVITLHLNIVPSVILQSW